MNKKPLIVIAAIVLGILVTNLLIPRKTDLAIDKVIEDSIETSQAASIPL